MSIQDNLIKCFQNSPDGFLLVYKNKEEIQAFQKKEKPTKGFKKVNESELVSLCAKYINEHKTLNQNEKDAINRVASQVIKPPKPNHGLEKVYNAVKNFFSGFKNGLAFRGFHSTHTLNAKKAQDLITLIKPTKVEGRESLKEQIHVEENKDQPEVPNPKANQDVDNSNGKPETEGKPNPSQPEEVAPPPPTFSEIPTDESEDQAGDLAEDSSEQMHEEHTGQEIKNNNEEASENPLVQNTEPAPEVEPNEEKGADLVNSDVPVPEIPPTTGGIPIGQRVPAAPLKLLSPEEAVIEMQKNLEEAVEENLQSLQTLNELPLKYIEEKLISTVFAQAYEYAEKHECGIDNKKISEEKRNEILDEVRSVYATKADLVKNPNAVKLKPKIDEKNYAAYNKQGSRPYNEDSECSFKVGDDSFVMITADGHSSHGGLGKLTATYLTTQAQQRLPEAIKNANGNFYVAINRFAFEVQREIINDEKMAEHGSTFCCCYITDGCIYTATVGDTDAYLLKKGKLYKLTPSRGWNHPEEKARGLKAEPTLAEEWTNAISAKACYFKKEGVGRVNNSRSFGDYGLTFGTNNEPAVIHTPVVTSYQLDTDDKDAYLLLACDGYWDFVAGPQTIENAVYYLPNQLPSFPQVSCDYAVDTMGGSDNVTVQIYKIEQSN